MSTGRLGTCSSRSGLRVTHRRSPRSSTRIRRTMCCGKGVAGTGTFQPAPRMRQNTCLGLTNRMTGRAGCALFSQKQGVCRGHSTGRHRSRLQGSNYRALTDSIECRRHD